MPHVGQDESAKDGCLEGVNMAGFSFITVEHTVPKRRKHLEAKLQPWHGGFRGVSGDKGTEPYTSQTVLKVYLQIHHKNWSLKFV